jgi:hypothetical protein
LLFICDCRGFPTDFPVVGCERRNVLEGGIIAREIREQAAPIEPCGTRLDIVRIAGFDMAGDLLRRCPSLPAATKTADWLRILRRTISYQSRFLSESFASACKRAITGDGGGMEGRVPTACGVRR